jgi:hypothetical protein
MVAMVAVPIVVRQVVLGTPGRAPSREIDPYELAYLSGGAERAADVAIAEFTHCGALLVAGILRYREGVANGRPVGSLTTLLIWSVIIGIVALLFHLG